MVDDDGWLVDDFIDGGGGGGFFVSFRLMLVGWSVYRYSLIYLFRQRI